MEDTIRETLRAINERNRQIFLAAARQNSRPGGYTSNDSANPMADDNSEQGPLDAQLLARGLLALDSPADPLDELRNHFNPGRNSCSPLPAQGLARIRCQPVLTKVRCLQIQS
jgi:hypothetical protein